MAIGRENKTIEVQRDIEGWRQAEGAGQSQMHN